VARNVNDIIMRLSAAQRKNVETRATQLIAEEMKLPRFRTLASPASANLEVPDMKEDSTTLNKYSNKL
jgi:hypothetical protein